MAGPKNTHFYADSDEVQTPKTKKELTDPPWS